MDCILAVDAGTTGTKFGLIDRQCRVYEGAKAEAKPIPPRTANAQEWDPKAAVANLATSLFRAGLMASKNRLNIKGIALTTTSSSLVCLQNHCPLSEPPPMRWDDRQSQKEANDLQLWREGSSSFDWLDPITPDTGVAKALFLLRHYAKLLANRDIQVMEGWTFLNWWLTERIVQAETILARKWGRTSRLNWEDPFASRLEAELRKLLATTGVSADVPWFENKMLPGQVIPAGRKIGPLRHSLAALVGLPAVPDVFSAPFDTCAQILGIGLVSPDDTAGISMGTSLGVCALAPEDDSTPAGRFGPFPATPLPHTKMLFDGIASCGSAINYVCQRFGMWSDGRPRFDAIDHALSSTEPGAEGVTMLPYFGGGRRASIVKPALGRIDGLRVGLDERLIVRALFEALAYLVRFIIEDMEATRRRRFAYLRVGGGPTKGMSFIKLLADVTGRQIQVSPFCDTSLLGAGLCASVGLGWHRSFDHAAAAFVHDLQPVKPNPDVANKYGDLYQRYLATYREFLVADNEKTKKGSYRGKKGS
jgi:xylulokinase